MSSSKILVTGGSGQIGSELVPALQKIHGSENVISVSKDDFNISDATQLENCIKLNQINTIYHLVSLLSATSEENPNLAWDINLLSLKNVLDLAVKYKLKVFWPSSIAAFGSTTPKNAPQHTILEPSTMYGVTKVSGELLCQYYHSKFNVDVRSLRYPGVVSWKTHPGGGTTDYLVAFFHTALSKDQFKCYLSPDTVLPMIYINDAIRATLELMSAKAENLSVRTSYNLAGFSVTPSQAENEITKTHPLNIIYSPDFRQQIADSWPDSIDDSVARMDWGWSPEYDLHKVCVEMFTNLKSKYE